jgi:hypothetical protein
MEKALTPSEMGKKSWDVRKEKHKLSGSDYMKRVRAGKPVDKPVKKNKKTQ